jgi:hypothetical protein
MVLPILLIHPELRSPGNALRLLRFIGFCPVKTLLKTIPIVTTKYRGVRRLSLAIAILAAMNSVYHGRWKPRYPGLIDESPTAILVKNMALAAIWFCAAWIAVRAIAWVIDGFVLDRKNSNGPPTKDSVGTTA